MTCNEVRQHWMLYFDSEGDPELHLHINAHLAMCPECAEWFAKQQRFEQALAERLAAGAVTPPLWERALARAKIVRPTVTRRRWLVRSGAAAAAAAVLLAVVLALLLGERSQPSELARIAADWHEQWVAGRAQPDKVSTSDEEVDRYLKEKVSFRVHCPPRTDVDFAVKGAGVRFIRDHQQAAYIVGQVQQAPVSILVLDRASLAVFPHESARLEGGQRYRCREGKYEMVSGIVADNVVLVIGTASADSLEKLLDAYGSYHSS